MRGLVVFRLLLALLVSHSVVRAQGMTGVGSDELPGQGAHAWVVVQESDDSWRLVHLPPRGFGEHAAKAGQIRPVLTLESPPDAMSAVGDRVYLIYRGTPMMTEPTEGQGSGESGGGESLIGDEARRDRKPIRVYSLRAVPVWGGYWSYEPAGEFRSHPTLEAGGLLIGAAPSGDALLIGLETENGQRSLKRLVSDRWEEVELGEFGLDDIGSPARLKSNGNGPVLMAEPFEVNATAHRFDERTILTRRVGESFRIIEEAGRQRWTIADLEGITGDVFVVPIRAGGGRLALLRREEGRTGADAFELVEVDLATGEVLHRAPPSQVSPISATEFRIFAALLVAFTLVLLLLTFRPGLDPAEVIIPEGLALADPGRRFFASAIDLLLVAGLVGAIYDTPVSSIVTGAVVFQAGGQWVTLPLTMILGGVLSALFECTLAGSPGKLLTGCRVACLGTVPRRMSPARALLRNGVKWLVPPIAALAMLDPQARHRGDDLARAAVVVRVRDEGDESKGESEGEGRA